eukprot:scaffold51694_cov18-Tisochrysis_lutea.AAC.1
MDAIGWHSDFPMDPPHRQRCLASQFVQGLNHAYPLGSARLLPAAFSSPRALQVKGLEKGISQYLPHTAAQQLLDQTPDHPRLRLLLMVVNSQLNCAASKLVSRHTRPKQAPTPCLWRALTGPAAVYPDLHPARQLPPTTRCCVVVAPGGGIEGIYCKGYRSHALVSWINNRC